MRLVKILIAQSDLNLHWAHILVLCGLYNDILFFSDIYYNSTADVSFRNITGGTYSKNVPHI